ncbi:hypothetical protein [Halolamina sediminis]|jgi:hypothetical protein|uniref:hypothetical protein n=1 Tax=Halolamina sediminis TaxID=1480675 RepID=UPI0006B49E09|nr:hypothetical protein [Halolamina sediminis]
MAADADALPFSRWWLVAVGALAMGTAGTYQFVWSSIRGPLGTQVGASEATLGWSQSFLLGAGLLAVAAMFGVRPVER